MMDSNQLASLSWIKPLNIVGHIEFDCLSPKSNLISPHVYVNFNKYNIDSYYESRWADTKTNANETWRKRPLLHSEDPGCLYTCGEVELTIRLRGSGLKAYWVSEWNGFPHVPMWYKYVIKRSELYEREPDIDNFDKNLRAFSKSKGIDLGKQGGHPDLAVFDPVTGWCFIEYKGPGDSPKAKQILWAETLATLYPDEVRYIVVKPFFST
jgi:hypothetical protein